MGSNQPLKVLIYGAKVLRQKAKPVTDFKGMTELGQQMLEEMKRSYGVGLAAPQVGIGQRILVADPSGFDAALKPMVLINPEIVERKGEEIGPEGCLSLPGVEVAVKRSKEIRVKAQATDGSPLDLKLKNFPARIIQHEIDHLDGVLLLDYLPAFERILAIWKLRKSPRRSRPAYEREKGRGALVNEL